MKVLILGGTTEASALASALAGDTRFQPLLSLAGRTRDPAAAPIPMRSGGFGGVAGLAACLREGGFAALIDATHPFAVRITGNAAAAAALVRVPHLHVVRPAWTAGPGDRWTVVPDMDAAAAALGPLPRRVLLTVGQQELAPFAARWQHDYLIRSVDPPDPALVPKRACTIQARGPFAAADEARLLRAERIEVLVTKNSGGAATSGKLDAARSLGLPVVMVARPPAPEGAVPDAAGALAWLHQLAVSSA